MAKFFEIRVTTWQEYSRLVEPLGGFYFRGHADASWRLTTSIEREFYRYDPSRIDSITNKEYWMLHEFRRKFHLYNSRNISEGDHFEWLALLQHYGAPTRLLDFTSSLYVAAYFALESSVTDACVWAIAWTPIRDNIWSAYGLDYKRGDLLRDQVNLHHIDLINKYVGGYQKAPPKPHLVPLESKHLSERVSRQKGLFLAPILLDGKVSFEQNLAASFGADPHAINDLQRMTTEEAFDTFDKYSWRKEVDVMKVVIPRDLHIGFLRHLVRMGIDRESLFPGLDGLASSLALTKLRGL